MNESRITPTTARDQATSLQKETSLDFPETTSLAMNTMRIHLCLYCVLLVLVTSCAAVMAGRYDYNLEVRNIGTARISDCEVSSEKGFKQRLGLLVPQAGDTTLGPFKYPYADRWTLTWKTAKGEKLTKTLDLMKAFPTALKGRLVLTIDKENNLGHFTEKYYGK